MSAAQTTPYPLIDRLPPVRGHYRVAAPLDKITWFQVGGAAEVLFKPEDPEDLAQFLKTKPHDVAVTVLGVGSNLLVRDGGISGVVIRLGRAFSDITVDGTTLIVGAGALDTHVASVACDHGLGGLEFLSGIPGTIGGALRMNAGAYGREIKDCMTHATALTPDGTFKTLSVDEMGFRYRHCALPQDWIFVSAHLRATPTEASLIRAEMTRIKTSRGDSQPIKSRTGGSTFANPDGHKAWQLVDRAGCRGLKIGGAQVSEQHCNFLINTGDATADDLETLGETVRQKVLETSGIALRWEIKRIGVKKGDPS